MMLKLFIMNLLPICLRGWQGNMLNDEHLMESSRKVPMQVMPTGKLIKRYEYT